MKYLSHPDKFESRHIGPSQSELEEMAKFCGFDSVDDLIEKTIPQNIRSKESLDIGESISEYEYLQYLKSVAKKNKVFKTYIGMGYYPTITPSVIKRNILQNPAWYTQYTPYQAEIAQGRLEALLNFQTMVSDLTGLPIANASLLDEGTAAAEAMTMFHNVRKKHKTDSHKFFVSEDIFPQTIDVLKTRAKYLGIELVIGDHKSIELNNDFYALVVQYPSNTGEIYDFENLFAKADEFSLYKIVIADILSLTLLTPPGEFGADCVVGSTQRFGVPMGYGGPHAAYFATKDEFKRNIPGRIIGVSVDSQGDFALRMALQTREQHIKREKATSNICTAQVLLAIMASMYAVYHGPENIKKIAERINNLTKYLSFSLRQLGLEQINDNYFDTISILLDKEKQNAIKKKALESEINLRYFENGNIGISLSEVTTFDDVNQIIEVFSQALDKSSFNPQKNIDSEELFSINSFPDNLVRKSPYLTHPVFNSYRSETEMMRYIKKLESKDLSLVHSMIPLGSCTMKLNAAVELEGITMSEFADLHPFIPAEQAHGYQEIFKELEFYLEKITGFSAVSLQPNSGAQGEYTGLAVIRAYFEDIGQSQRNIVLIPCSAHGTNPASAVMAGMKVVIVNCDPNGNIDFEDFKKKAEQYKDTLAALMVTYPSTHGVFEETIKEVCEIVHQKGGQVYMDGANLNAQVGLTSPAIIGADVCHINLHKTFSIPHGGGGPGMGPIAVAEHLVKYLPGHSVVKNINREKSITAVSAAPWGSALILLISHSYIKMMGSEGLTSATKTAIVNANYIKNKLKEHFKPLYVGLNNTVAHELIFDMRMFKQSAGIEVEDIAKRLMDYGYHAPTVSFPVPGTLMVEPTESESKAELDRFCDVMISIRQEIAEIENGIYDKEDNVLKNAPHTLKTLISDEWKHSYSREKAAFPLPYCRDNKFWPSVSRVDNAYGDRNLVCSCLPVDYYVEREA
jgi:glycine dehydrogenase